MPTLQIRITALAAAALLACAPAFAQKSPQTPQQAGDPEAPKAQHAEKKVAKKPKTKATQTPQQAGDPEAPKAHYSDKKAQKGPKKPRTKTSQTPQEKGDPEMPAKK